MTTIKITRTTIENIDNEDAAEFILSLLEAECKKNTKETDAFMKENFFEVADDEYQSKNLALFNKQWHEKKAELDGDLQELITLLETKLDEEL